MRLFLSKKIAWILIAFLVYLDAFLDLIVGKGMGNPLWKPFVDIFGNYIVLILAIPVIILLFVFVKVLAKIIYKIDRLDYAEEILLTALAIIYALFDLWLISVDFLGFSLITNFRYTIPFLIFAGLVYALWAEHKVKIGKPKKEQSLGMKKDIKR